MYRATTPRPGQVRDVNFLGLPKDGGNPVDAVKRRMFESPQDSNEFDQQAKIARRRIPGFCVICEEEGLMRDHLAKEHRTGHPSNPIYEIVDFEGTEIVAFQGTHLFAELAKCPSCLGVFYKNRVENHLCTHPDRRSIDEGSGPEYCLMCQRRTENIELHKFYAHGFSNPIYHVSDLTVATGTRIRAYMPTRDIEGDLTFFNRCACGNCLRVTFKNRVRRICPATEPGVFP